MVRKMESQDTLLKKEGIFEKDGTLYVRGIEYINRVANVLSSKTRLKILKLIREKERDIGEIAEFIGQSKANASAQIKRLEDIGLIKTSYKPGQRGVKKVCWTNIREVRIMLD